MPAKQIVFDFFRYQILPKRTQQLKLFNDVDISFEDLKSRKNEFFMEVFLDKNTVYYDSFNDKLRHKIVHHNDNIVAMKLGKQKNVLLTNEELEDEEYIDYPIVYVIIDNDEHNQKIAISRDAEAFSNSFVVANILEENLSKFLDKYSLEVVVNPVLDSAEFWDLVAKYETRITQLQFNLIRPNMSNISGTFKNEIRDLTDSTNSLVTKVELNAPKGSTLENINKNNEYIKDLAEYAIKGGAQFIHMRVKGVRKIIKTEKAITTLKIDSVELSGTVENVNEVYKQITTD